VTNDEPDFEVLQLPESSSSSDLKLYIFAVNAKGSSEPFVISQNLGGRLLRQKESGE